MFNMHYHIHAAIKRLMASGFSEEMAEAIITEIRDAHDFDFFSLATKAELHSETALLRSELQQEATAIRAEMKQEGILIRSELRQEMQEMRAELTGEIHAVRHELAASHRELMRWMFGGFIATIGILMTVMLKFLH